MRPKADTPFVPRKSRLAHGNKTLKSKIMRTKTILLSALMGAISSVSVMAQTNVYSQNAVGYINVSLGVGFNMISCPLVCSPDNTVGTLFNNASSNLTGCDVYFYTPFNNGYSEDIAKNYNPTAGKSFQPNTNGWEFNGTNVLAPGSACWFDNNLTGPITITFVGQVATGPVTNTLNVGFNMVSSIVPMAGDLITNSISQLTNYNITDDIYYYTPANNGYLEYVSLQSSSKIHGYGFDSQWNINGDPTTTNVYDGFWYDANVATVKWVENYSVSQ
jgi:hypothetical protein